MSCAKINHMINDKKNPKYSMMVSSESHWLSLSSGYGIELGWVGGWGFILRPVHYCGVSFSSSCETGTICVLKYAQYSKFEVITIICGEPLITTIQVIIVAMTLIWNTLTRKDIFQLSS